MIEPDQKAPPVDGLILRLARNEDADAIRTLVFGVLVSCGLAPDPSAIDADIDDIEANFMARGGRFDVLVDLATNAIVGTVALYRLSDHTLELRKMYLHADYRRRGLGKFLLRHALAHAGKLGCRTVVLETASVLKEAIALYRQFGFQPRCGAHLSKRCDQAMELTLDDWCGVP